MERITYREVPTIIYEKLRGIEDYLEQSTIGIPLLELIRLRISQINGCAYCVDMHYKELKHTNETELRLSSLCVWKETPYFSNKERATLQFAEALNKLGLEPIPDLIYDPLLDYFTKEEIIILSLAISQIKTWNTLMKVFGFTPGLYKVTK